MMPSIPQLLIILGIIVLIFGFKRLRNIGSDLGSAVKSFKKAVSSSNDDDAPMQNTEAESSSKSKSEEKDNG